MTTPTEAAEWMLRRVEKSGVLHQDDAVGGVADNFGKCLTTENAAGNPVISKQVLTAFKNISPHIVWSRGERCWRKREKGDEPGRNQP